MSALDQMISRGDIPQGNIDAPGSLSSRCLCIFDARALHVHYSEETDCEGGRAFAYGEDDM